MKTYLEGRIKEYESVRNMTDEDVMREYDDNKSNVLRDYETEIDWYERKIYG